jgi:D-tyrosyl-tRNA(Tyr) deacylase
MRILLQRVNRASVTVEGSTAGAIGRGFLLLVGATASDTGADLDYLAEKIANLRVFQDDAGAMNRSALDLLAAADGDIGMLVVSQFTLYADVRKGRRPSFNDAAPPDLAEPLVAGLAERLRERGFPVAEGRFGATMAVELVNDGPVTIWLDTADLRPVLRSSSAPGQSV